MQGQITALITRSLILLSFALLPGCGGTVLHGFPWHAPGLSVDEVTRLAATNADAPGPRGSRVPVGIRAYGDEYLVIDVLILRPMVDPYYSPDPDEDTRRLHYFYVSGLAFEAADGKGLAIRQCSGDSIPLIPMPISDPPDAATRARYSLQQTLDSPEIEISIHGDRYRAIVVPIIVRCAGPVPIGSCLVARISSKEYFGGTTPAVECRAVASPVFVLSRGN